MKYAGFVDADSVLLPHGEVKMLDYMNGDSLWKNEQV
ncbi:hypothetical protein SAMN05216391_1502 [Lachnospiraceae bacterium KHCPX20]|nr:hypothetical protein SAMN05216391_1502 [Lachnospiraceae bacterium KHCPX20]